MKEALKAQEICLGNFIESMGNIEIVTGIIQESNGNFKIGHSGWNKGEGVIPDGILYDTYPIPLTDEWKKCFGIDKYKLPDHIQHVHQVQNYFFWALQINVLEIMDWDLRPKTTELIEEEPNAGNQT